MTGFSKDWPWSAEECLRARRLPWQLSEDGSFWITGEGEIIEILESSPPLTRSAGDWGVFGWPLAFSSGPPGDLQAEGC